MANNANLDLTLRLRANADGSLSVIPQTTAQINNLSHANDRASQSALQSSQSLNHQAISLLDLNGAARAAAGGLSLIALYNESKNVINYADSLQMLDSRVKINTQSTSDFRLANAALIDISLKTHSALEGNVTLFTKTNKSIEAMGGSLRNTIAFTDILAKSLKISGTAASEQSALTRQVAQALASGVLRGDEYNSVMENGARFAYALADGLHVNIGVLRSMAEAGALTTDKVFPAILYQYQKIDAEFKQLPVSVAAAFNNIETQFGRYINTANTAHQSTSKLASGVDIIAEHLHPILDGLVVIGETIGIVFISKGISALASYGIAQRNAIALNAAHSAAILQDRQITISRAEANLQSTQVQLADVMATQSAIAAARSQAITQLQATNAEIARAQATIAATSATVQSTAIIYIRQQAEQQLMLAEQQHLAVIAELSLLGSQQARISAQITTAQEAQALATEQLSFAQQAMSASSASLASSFRLLLNPLNLLNVGFSALIGWEVGSWLNQFTVVSDTASEVIGRWAQEFEDLGYKAEYSKAILTGNWSSISQLTQAHEQNTQAIYDNVQGTLAWHDTLAKANLSEESYKDLKLSLIEPQQQFINKTKEITLAFNSGLISLKEYITTLVSLRDEMDRLNTSRLSAFQKELLKIQDEQDQIRLSPLDYKIKKIKADPQITNPDEQDRLIQEARVLLDLQAQQKQQQEQLTAAKKASHKEENQAAKLAEKTAQEYAQLVYQMQKELALHGDNSKAAALQYDIENGLLDKYSEKQQIRLFQLAGDQDFQEAQDKANQAEKSALESINDQYQKLTLSARNYYIETLKTQGVSPEGIQKALPIYDKTQAAESQKSAIDKSLQSLRQYNDSLDSANAKTQDLGAVSSSVFDGALGGVNQLSGVFNHLVDAIEKNVKALDSLHKKQQENTDLGKTLDQVQRDHLEETVGGVDALKKKQAEVHSNALKYAQEEKDLSAQNLQTTLHGVSQMAGAMSQMFAENSKGRKAFHTIQMAFSAVEMAQELKGLAVKAAAAVLEQGKGDPYSAFARIAAMTAVVAGIVAAAGGSFSAGGGSSAPAQVNTGTGTVLGDPNAQSDSVNKTYELLKAIHATEYVELRGINRGVSQLNSGINNVITRVFQAGGIKDPAFNGTKQLSLVGDVLGGFSIYRDFMRKIPIIGSLGEGIAEFILGGLFGETSQSISGGGIYTPSTSVGNLLSGQDLQAYQYTTIKTVTESWFSSSTKYSEVLRRLDGDVNTALNQVFHSMSSTMLAVAEQLGGNLVSQVNAYVIPSMRVELRGLSAEAASKQLNAVISAALDTMATRVFGDVVGQYQQLGEGMLETATRLVTEVAVVKDALKQSGMSLAGDALAISDALVTAAGGLSEFQKQFGDYYDKFYNAEEKQTRLQQSLTTSLNTINLSLPAARDGYRDLVESLDLSNAKDRERYTLLLKLSSAADQYFSTLENHLKTLNDDVTSAYSTAATLLKDQINSYSGFVEQFKTFSQTLLTGSNSTASPEQKYFNAKDAYQNLKAVLTTGTDTEKAIALGQLQGVTQTFLDTSRAYNASGMGYVKDFVDAQALLAKEIDYASGKKDIAQSQLDALTEQLTALGLIKASVDNVNDAVKAVGIALAGLEAYQHAQTATANRAAFDKLEAGRLSDYEAPIADKATTKNTLGGKIENMVGWSANTSKQPFGVSGIFDLKTDAIIGTPSAWSNSSSGADNVEKLTYVTFPHIKGSLSLVAKQLQKLIGGNLPQVSLAFGDSEQNGLGYMKYSFGNVAKTINSDSLVALERSFANDMTDYLANQMTNKEWAKQIKDIQFSTMGAGLSELSRLMDHLKKPFTPGVFDPDTDYTKIDGSHRNGLKRVPYDGYIAEVHKDERILTADQTRAYDRLTQPLKQSIEIKVKANDANDKEVIEQLHKTHAEMAAQTKAMQRQIEILQAGFVQLIKQGEQQVDSLDDIKVRTRVKSLA